MTTRPPVPAVRSAVGVALRKELWSFGDNRIAVRFQYECHDSTGQCWRSYGNEFREFTDDGLLRRREASINDVAIAEDDRRIHGPRAARERGLLLRSGEPDIAIAHADDSDWWATAVNTLV